MNTTNEQEEPGTGIIFLGKTHRLVFTVNGKKIISTMIKPEPKTDDEKSLVITELSKLAARYHYGVIQLLEAETKNK